MQVFPLLFPHCAEPMTIIAFVTEAGLDQAYSRIPRPADNPAPHYPPAARRDSRRETMTSIKP